MAVVVDQYGGVEGIITFQDVIEQLVGNIYELTILSFPIFNSFHFNI